MEKFAGAHHSHNINNGLKDVFSLGAAAVPCALAIVRLSLQHISFHSSRCCLLLREGVRDPALLSGFDQVSSISRGWQVSLSRHHYHLNLLRRSRLLFPSTRLLLVLLLNYKPGSFWLEALRERERERERESVIITILDDYKLGTREEKRRAVMHALLRITLWWVFSWYHVFFNAKIFPV